MANVIKVTAENADELLNAGAYGAGALIQIQSSATEAGAFVDISGTGSTPTIALVAGTYTYSGYDPNGASTTWYKTRFRNVGGTLVSDYSAAFQASAEGSGLLASLYDLKQRLEIPYTDTAQDENLLEWLRQATSFIHTFTGRVFTPDGTTTYRVHTTSGYRLYLPRGIVSVTTLGVATTNQPASGGTYTTATAADYYLDPPAFNRSPGWPANAICFLPSGASGSVVKFYTATFGAEITGTFGFPSIPSDISGIALTLAVSSARERGAGGGDTVTVGIGGERTFERALSYKDRLTLEKYRMMLAA
jgi:hypothetical protein